MPPPSQPSVPLAREPVGNEPERLPFLERVRATWPRWSRRVATPFIGALTVGLAPAGEPAHVRTQLVTLVQGRSSGRDLLDLLFHGAPWLWLGLVVAGWLVAARRHTPPTIADEPPPTGRLS